MIDENRLSLLFARLAWPSPLVRERACVEVAHLLLDAQLAASTSEFFLRWLGSQQLESFAVNGLLSLLYAQSESGGAKPVAASDVRAALSRPSLLSALLLDEYAPGEANRGELRLLHSGAAPADFKPSFFFEKYSKSYLPPIYDWWAKQVERDEHIQFRRQWSYEWQEVLNRVGVKLSTKPLDFWLGGHPRKKRHPAADMPLSEVYRSAYLLALAWCLEKGPLTRGNADFLTAQTCPIDLELWRLQPKTRPEWWRRVAEPSGPIDTVPPEVLTAVFQLWHSQQAGEPPWARDWMLGAASGRVFEGRSIYDLEIFSFFQKCLGPNHPEPEELIHWFTDDEQTRIHSRCPSLLRFREGLEPTDPQERARAIGDWSVVPAVGRLRELATAPRWQWWRLYRDVWSPTPFFRRGPYEFGYGDQALEFCADGQVIARWDDWTEGVRERLHEDLSPPTGQGLFLRREVVDEFARESGSIFCWVCRIQGYHREHDYQDYKQFTLCQTFGASGIVMPGSWS